MKRVVLTCVLVTLVVTPALAGTEKSVGLGMAQIQAERRAIIEATVEPSPQQSEEFWQTYWEYRGHVGVLNDATVKIIEEFANGYMALNDDQAARMVNQILALEKQRTELKQDYVKKFQKILIPKQVMRWYQTENKMDAVIRAEMAAAIPFDR